MNKEQIVVVDATKPPEDIAKAILNRIEQFITAFREVER